MTAHAHLDDESLSALLDGDIPDAHVATCEECQARLQRLAAVASAIGAPISPPNPARRQAHINAALAARAAAPPQSLSRPATRKWLTVAAGLVLVAGAAAGIGLAAGRHRTANRVSAALAGPERTQAGSSGSLPDLGPQHDLATVAALLRRAARPAANPSGAPGAGSSSADAGIASGSAATGGAASASPAPQAATPPAPQAVAAGPCSGPGPDGQLLLASAYLSWDGTPAVVFAYSPDGRTARLFIEVRALSGCSVLASQTIGSS